MEHSHGRRKSLSVNAPTPNVRGIGVGKKDHDKMPVPPTGHDRESASVGHRLKVRANITADDRAPVDADVRTFERAAKVVG